MRHLLLYALLLLPVIAHANLLDAFELEKRCSSDRPDQVNTCLG